MLKRISLCNARALLKPFVQPTAARPQATQRLPVRVVVVLARSNIVLSRLKHSLSCRLGSGVMHAAPVYGNRLAFLVAAICCLSYTTASKWEIVHKTTKDLWGGKNRHSIRSFSCSGGPCTRNLSIGNLHEEYELKMAHCGCLCRYSHCVGLIDDQLVITHGYFYNTEVKGPQWLSDTWVMSLQSPYAMHQVHSRCLMVCKGPIFSTSGASPV